MHIMEYYHVVLCSVIQPTPNVNIDILYYPQERVCLYTRACMRTRVMGGVYRGTEKLLRWCLIWCSVNCLQGSYQQGGQCHNQGKMLGVHRLLCSVLVKTWVHEIGAGMTQTSTCSQRGSWSIQILLTKGHCIIVLEDTCAICQAF